MAISLISVVSALSISFQAPSSVQVGEEFTIEISADSSEAYDVKIYVPDTSARSRYFSEILVEGVWKNPHQYIRGVFPAQRTFSIRVPSFTGEGELCVRLRASGSDTSEAPVCHALQVEGSSEGSSEEPDEAIEELEEEREAVVEPRPAAPSFEPVLPVPTVKREKIVLSQEKQEEQEVVSFEGNVRTYALWTFIGFCILVGILALLGKV